MIIDTMKDNMNKETICYIILGLLVSTLSVVAKERINKNDVEAFINGAKGVSELLKMITKPFCNENNLNQ